MSNASRKKIATYHMRASGLVFIQDFSVLIDAYSVNNLIEAEVQLWEITQDVWEKRKKEIWTFILSKKMGLQFSSPSQLVPCQLFPKANLTYTPKP